jgi:hypothetical protein
MIIGICGLKGSGKNTIGDYLKDKYNFKLLSFAGILKDVISIIFGWDRNMLEGITEEDRKIRETKDEWWSKRLGIDCTPRWVMQNLGTDVIRKYFNDNIWIYAMEKEMEKYENVVITDVRFTNEIEFLLSKNALLIYVEREEPQEWFHDLTKVPKELHISEWSWIKYKPEICVNNKGTLEELYVEIVNKLEKYI